MAMILRLKDPETGEWVEVPALKGTSAYQSAQQGGYTGSEQQFYKDLAAVGVVGVHRYGIRWDKVSATCTRLYDAADITTTTTHFCYRGSVDASYSNPFDDLYPWKYRRVVNTDLAAYQQYLAGNPKYPTLESCILKEFGEEGFVSDSATIPVDVYTPEFWYLYTIESDHIDLIIADGPIPGYTHVPETLGGRWFGKYNADEVPLSLAGIPTVNVSVSTLHQKLVSAKMTCEDIWTWCADTILQYVEYACLNTQTNVGNGDSDTYQEGNKCTQESTGTTINVPAAVISKSVVGLMVDLGTSSSGKEVARTSIVSIDDAANTLTLADSVTVTTETYISLHGIINYAADLATLGNKSGYIGINGRSQAYYRGRVSHASRFRYLLGVYREGTTDMFWVAPTPEVADSLDALDKTKCVPLGVGLPDAGTHDAGGGGIIKTLHSILGLPFIALCSSIGGNSSAPTGDYYYWPASSTGDTVCIFGGNSNYGSYAGRSYWYWLIFSSYSYWYYSVVPFYKSRS